MQPQPAVRSAEELEREFQRWKSQHRPTLDVVADLEVAGIILADMIEVVREQVGTLDMRRGDEDSRSKACAVIVGLDAYMEQVNGLIDELGKATRDR